MYVKTLHVTSCSSLRKSYICMLAFQKVSVTVYSYPCINLNTRGWEIINLRSFFIVDLIHFWMMRDLPPICKET